MRFWFRTAAVFLIAAVVLGSCVLLSGNFDFDGFNVSKYEKAEYICAEPVTYKGEIVSSTRIREMLRNGEVKAANEILYEPFSFTAKVMQGDKRGRTIGFPTVNQRYPENLVKLKFGVYKTKINIDGKEYCGITDIGTRPTFKTDYVISETFIKDFSGDLYGKELKITPLEFLRDEKKFNSLEELKKQIAEDLRR